MNGRNSRQTEIDSIYLLGFGEVGQTLAADLADTKLTAYDILFADDHSTPSKALKSSAAQKCDTAIEAAENCDLIISAVTAAEDLNAAESVAGAVSRGSYFLDLNSVAPHTKESAARIIDSSGGRYVEAAVMSPIAPKRIASPMLLGGPYASEFKALAASLGFSGASVYSERIGEASAAKMCRSIVVKGIESLLSESMLTARHYHVEEDVLQSLGDLFPGIDWPELARYMISRSVEHGTRRAEEMREVVATVADAGLAPLMSEACARRQDWAASFKNELRHEALTEMLDAMLSYAHKSS